MEGGGRRVGDRVIQCENRLDRSSLAWKMEGVYEARNGSGLEAAKGKRTIFLEPLEPC